jgi:hypothetical protein
LTASTRCRLTTPGPVLAASPPLAQAWADPVSTSFSGKLSLGFNLQDMEWRTLDNT